MAENLLDQAKAQQALVMPRMMNNPRLDYFYRLVENAVNSIAKKRQNAKFIRSVELDPSSFSKNPELAKVMGVIDGVMDKFKMNRVNSESEYFGNEGINELEDYHLRDKGIELPIGNDDFKLEDIVDANFVRHSATNYDDLKKLFNNRMHGLFSLNHSANKNFLRRKYQDVDKNGEVISDNIFKMLDDNGYWQDPYYLFRKRFNDKMKEIIPSYDTAKNTLFNSPDLVERINKALPFDEVRPPVNVYDAMFNRMYPLQFANGIPDIEGLSRVRRRELVPDEADKLIANGQVIDANADDIRYAINNILANYGVNLNTRMVGRPPKKVDNSIAATQKTIKNSVEKRDDGTSIRRSVFDPTKFRR